MAWHPVNNNWVWEIPPRMIAKIPTGLHMEIQEGYEMQVRPRSGMSLNHQCPAILGTVDSDYRGEISVLLMNLNDFPVVISHGDRIAQGVFAPATRAQFEFVNEVSQTARGSGGFGSTGV